MKNLIPDKFVQKINWLQLLSVVGILMWSSLALAATDCSAVNEIPQLECEALVALYNSTNGPNWYDNQTNNWNKTNTPCSWAGITCEGSSPQHVTSIIREGQRLVGTLSNLSALTFLKKLDLEGYLGCWSCKNQLEGTLPDLSTLTQLTDLDLSYNQFKGNIEPSFLPANLTSLNLSYNQFEGNIVPSSLPANLTYLYLQRNQLKGAIPDFSSLTSLENLDLSSNYELEGPIDATFFPLSLTSLVLSNTKLKQPLPDDATTNLSNLSNLTYLDLSSTQLTGTVLASHFPGSLTSLDLSDNPLEQPLPDFSTLTNLITLNLSSCSLTGSIDPAVFPLTLQYLYLYSNQLIGQIPNFKDRPLTNLIYIDLSYNNTSDSF